MILEVVRFPHPVLKTSASPADPADPAVQKLIADMLETMNHHNRCVGLAAPQVGVSKCVIVVDASRIDKPGTRHGPVALVNPVLKRLTGEKMLREGCLSVPDYTGNVIRGTKALVQGLDPQGKELIIEAEGFEAIVFQHELDHLGGKLFLDRVGSLETDVFRRKKYA
jgi:peptide deformylase